MLPRISCGIGEILRGRGLKSKGTAYVLEDFRRGERICPDLGIVQQSSERLASMVMRHGPPQLSPEPLNAIAIRIVAGGVDQDQVLAVLLDQGAQQLGAADGVDAQVVEQDDGHPAAGLGALYGPPELGAQGLRGALLGQSPVEPTLPPVDQPEAPLLLILPRRLHQALTPASRSAPHASQGGMEGDLHLILQVQIGAREEAEQLPHEGIILGQVELQWTKHDTLSGWLEYMFGFCEGKHVAYYSHYVPSTLIHAIARAHGVHLIHIPLLRLPKAMLTRNQAYRSMYLSLSQWQALGRHLKQMNRYDEAALVREHGGSL